MPPTMPASLLATLSEPGSEITTHDHSFPWEVTRIGLGGETLRLTVEALITEGEPRHVALICEAVALPQGFAIQADSTLFLSPEEISAIECSCELADYLRECHEADVEAEQEASERFRESRREARSFGLIKSY